MPLKAQLSHRVVKETNLPYVTNNSPTSTDVIFDAGSADILTSISGYCQRRPGFADDVEPTPTVFNDLQRLFTFERTNGDIYIIACDVTATTSLVYEMLSGADPSFTLIYTDTGNPTPFDFVVSNNTLYFANGHETKKWDPINGVSNWGISIAGFVGATSAYAGTGADAGGSWTSPTNAQGAPDGVYASAPASSSGTATSNLNLTNYGFAIATTSTIVGFQVNVVCHSYVIAGVPSPSTFLYAQLLQSGVPVGSPITLQMTTDTDQTLSFGSSSNLWGTTWTPTQVNLSSFGVALYIINTDTNFSTQNFIDSAQIVVTLSGPPTATAAAPGSGAWSALNGYRYVCTYGNSNTGHISSPTAPSNWVKPATASEVTIAITASTDPQVNQIHVYRTTDIMLSTSATGGQTYFELPNSPVANSTGTFHDTTADDTLLNIYSIAPTPTFNDPPPLWQGMVYFSGRIWGYVGNKVWFTGLEEIINGVPEESVPSGTGGNFWAFDQPVNALGVAGIGDSQILAVFCAGRIYAITGNSLDTFRRTLISNRRGCRSRTNVSMLGGMCAWIDTSNQIWVSNGVSLQELSPPVRPDFASINQSQTCLTFHVAENYHWLVVSLGESLMVYDVDMEQWMPPWSFSCQYLYSGETLPGNYELMACKPTKAIKMNPTSFNDDGVTYSPVVITNLFSLPSEESPSRTGTPFYIQADTNNANSLSDCGYVVDDDSTTTAFTSIFGNRVSPEMAYNRAQGTSIVQQVFPMNGPVGRWISIAFTMRDADVLDNLYSYFVAQEADGPEANK